MHVEKWHGIGNDFLLVTEDELARERADGSIFVSTWPGDNRARLEDDAVVATCDRHFGIGGDGILVLGPSEVADARMLIHNADGSMAEMCGNGIRVAARFLLERELVQAGADGSFAIETAGGIMRPTVLDDNRVRVDMGLITSEGATSIDLATVNADLAGQLLEGRVVSVGNPHFVIRRSPAGPDLHRFGPLVERHPRFPNRTNVEFWELASDSPEPVVQMRVWERGVGETLACGTGACAVAYSARIEAELGDHITVRLPGGDLEIEFDGDRAHMTGAGHMVWAGDVDVTRIVAGLPYQTAIVVN